MTNFLVYWAAGCLMMGWAMGAIIKECPARANERVEFQMVAMVAVWPMYLVAAATIGKDILPKSECPGAAR